MQGAPDSTRLTRISAASLWALALAPAALGAFWLAGHALAQPDLAGETAGGLSHLVICALLLGTSAVFSLALGTITSRRALRQARIQHENLIELRARETELARLTLRHSLALDASGVGIWDYSTASDTQVWDARMAELYGVPPDNLTHSYQDWLDLIHPEDRARVDAECRDRLATGGRHKTGFRLLRPDGTIRHIRALGDTCAEPDGSKRVIGVNWDATADVAITTELELKRRGAEAATIAKSQFLATMSHEIRTPMAGVIGMLDLMLRDDLSPSARARAETARNSAGQMLDLLNDLLDFSRLEVSGITLRPEPCDVARIARDVLALVSASAEEQRTSLDARIDPDLPARILCDPKRLRQILANLVGNAVKFTEAGSVRLEIDWRDDRLQVTVRDTGIGISETARAGLFQRFSQIDNPITRVRDGSGLGLAICKELVELMGGEISVDSVEGLGSAFHFHIPAMPAAPALPEPLPAPAAPQAPPARILVAEDNATNRQILAAYLAFDGHAAHMVSDGGEVVSAVLREDFDLVILDIHMPRMDGISAARALRALPGPQSRLPILALTATAQDSDRQICLEAGMTDFLSKPVSVADLRAAITRVMAPAV